MNKPCCCPHCGYCSKPPRIEYMPSYYPRPVTYPWVGPLWGQISYSSGSAVQPGVSTMQGGNLPGLTSQFNQQAQQAAAAEACCEAPKA